MLHCLQESQRFFFSYFRFNSAMKSIHRNLIISLFIWLIKLVAQKNSHLFHLFFVVFALLYFRQSYRKEIYWGFPVCRRSLILHTALSYFISRYLYIPKSSKTLNISIINSLNTRVFYVLLNFIFGGVDLASDFNI